MELWDERREIPQEVSGWYLYVTHLHLNQICCHTTSFILYPYIILLYF